MDVTVPHARVQADLVVVADPFCADGDGPAAPTRVAGGAGVPAPSQAVRG